MTAVHRTEKRWYTSSQRGALHTNDSTHIIRLKMKKKAEAKLRKGVTASVNTRRAGEGRGGRTSTG